MKGRNRIILASLVCAVRAAGSGLLDTNEALFRPGLLNCEQIVVGRLARVLPHDEHVGLRAATIEIERPLYGVTADQDTLVVNWVAHRWSDGKGSTFTVSDDGPQLDELRGRRVLWGLGHGSRSVVGEGDYCLILPLDLDELSRADLRTMLNWVEAPDTTNGFVQAFRERFREREAAEGGREKLDAVAGFLKAEIAARAP